MSKSRRELVDKSLIRQSQEEMGEIAELIGRQFYNPEYLGPVVQSPQRVNQRELVEPNVEPETAYLLSEDAASYIGNRYGSLKKKSVEDILRIAFNDRALCIIPGFVECVGLISEDEEGKYEMTGNAMIIVPKDRELEWYSKTAEPISMTTPGLRVLKWLPECPDLDESSYLGKHRASAPVEEVFPISSTPISLERRIYTLLHGDFQGDDLGEGDRNGNIGINFAYPDGEEFHRQHLPLE